MYSGAAKEPRYTFMNTKRNLSSVYLSLFRFFTLMLTGGLDLLKFIVQTVVAEVFPDFFKVLFVGFSGLLQSIFGLIILIDLVCHPQNCGFYCDIFWRAEVTFMSNYDMISAY